MRGASAAATRPLMPPPRGMVDVTTSDEEFFPVKRRLLRPCIKLTSAVMAGAGVHADASTEATVPVDCCTFDRVLLFLEAQAAGEAAAAAFSFGAEHTDAMLQASSAKRVLRATAGTQCNHTMCRDRFTCANARHAASRLQATASNPLPIDFLNLRRLVEYLRVPRGRSGCVSSRPRPPPTR